VKGQLVDAAEEVFRRKGFSATSIQDLTDAAAVPKGSFYNHFGSKADLAAGIVASYVRATDTSALATTDGPVIERLRAHFAEQIERTSATGVEFGCLLGTFAGEVPVAGETLREAVDQAMAAWTGAVAATIREGQDRGEITKAHSADTLAALLIDTFEGAAMRAKVTRTADGVIEKLDITLAALAA
jgi:TetR/AcrR family transcriptional regulator, transcriptional repressor for nem operon